MAPVCNYCGTPILGTGVWFCGRSYHAHCMQAGFASLYAPSDPNRSGQCIEAKPFTEADVRRIVVDALVKYGLVVRGEA